MKRRLFTFAIAALTIGLLGSCSKINERIDGLDERVYDLENNKIASVEQQITAINQSIADLETIRTNIQNLKNEQEAQGQDITTLKAADITLEGKINDLKSYVDTELSKYATTEWAKATFATLEQLNTTNTELGALKETVGKLGETFDGKLADLKTELTNSITSAIAGVNASISALEARVGALEQMIQSVNITPAYSDGSVEAVNGILTLKCIVSPAEAIIGMESLKDSLLIYADSVKVKTKATTPAYMTIKVSEASVLDAAQGAITLTADISEYLPKGKDKALTVAVNIRNGISDFTTEFVPVSVADPDIPEGALPGVFSVGTTKKVQFSRGNLFWDGDSYEFEANQYTIGTWNAENHVNYFFWSKEESVAKAASYADASAAAGDVFFTNATAVTANADFTVSGVTGEFRTLSAEEWTHILSTRANAADLLVEDVTVCGVEHCLVIAPDACLNSYEFDKTKKSYDAAAWATAEAAGLICLPPAGYRDGTDVKSGEGNGFYWASTTDAADKASNLGFKKSDN